MEKSKASKKDPAFKLDDFFFKEGSNVEWDFFIAIITNYSKSLNYTQTINAYK